MFDTQFYAQLEENIRKFHSIFRHNRLKAELLEEVISMSMTHIPHEWDCYSHKSKYDILAGSVSISVKSGSIKKDKLKISSFRTTKYKTIEEKVAFIEESHSDVMVSMVSSETGYEMYVIPKSVFDLSDREWTTKGANYESINNVVNVRISHSMSDQVWYELNLTALGLKPVWQMTI